MDAEQNLAPPTVAEAVTSWERFKASLATAADNLQKAERQHKAAVADELAARKTFNAAVEALRPKRGPRKAKAEGGAA